MKTNKLFSVFVFFILICVLLCACGEDSGNTEKNISEITPQPRPETNESDVVESVYGDTPSLTVTQTVAYIFDGLRNNEVYAACEYVNDSDCPARITSITYNLDISGQALSVTAEQPASMYCSIYPGETFYNAIWHDIDCTATDTISVVSVDIVCEKSLDERYLLTIKDTFLVQNYPDFSTVTGVITDCPETVELNTIYMGFYDDTSKLLGVWYFTDASELTPETEKHFTTHLRSLPIAGLVDKTSQIKACGFGFNTKN